MVLLLTITWIINANWGGSLGVWFLYLKETRVESEGSIPPITSSKDHFWERHFYNTSRVDIAEGAWAKCLTML